MIKDGLITKKKKSESRGEKECEKTSFEESIKRRTLEKIIKK